MSLTIDYLCWPEFCLSENLAKCLRTASWYWLWLLPNGFPVSRCDIKSRDRMGTRKLPRPPGDGKSRMPSGRSLLIAVSLAETTVHYKLVNCEISEILSRFILWQYSACRWWHYGPCWCLQYGTSVPVDVDSAVLADADTTVPADADSTVTADADSTVPADGGSLVVGTVWTAVHSVCPHPQFPFWNRKYERRWGGYIKILWSIYSRSLCCKMQKLREEY